MKLFLYNKIGDKMEYNIRPINKEEIYIVNDFLTKLIQDERKYDENINKDFIITEYYEHCYNNENTILLLCENKNIPYGYIYGYIRNDGDSSIKKTAVIDALYVEEKYRNNGIATNLINEFIKQANKQGAKIFEISVVNANTDAYNLYKKLNFKPIKSIMKYKSE